MQKIIHFAYMFIWKKTMHFLSRFYIQNARHFAIHFYMQKTMHVALRFICKIYLIVLILNNKRMFDQIDQIENKVVLFIDNCLFPYDN